MIIWGSKSLTGTLSSGQFHCPACAAPKLYDQRRVRKFFTLYFIPLFPTSTLGQYIECQGCRGTFDAQVLSYDPAKEVAKAEAIFITAVKQIMIHVCLADGTVDDQEVLQIQKIFAELTGTQIAEETLRGEIARISQGANTLFGLIDQVSAQLNSVGKETALRAAYLIASADGEVDQREWDLIQEVAKRIGVSSAHLNGVITSVQAEG